MKIDAERRGLPTISTDASRLSSSSKKDSHLEPCEMLTKAGMDSLSEERVA
jgi:hypothetical protein